MHFGHENHIESIKSESRRLIYSSSTSPEKAWETRFCMNWTNIVLLYLLLSGFHEYSNWTNHSAEFESLIFATHGQIQWTYGKDECHVPMSAFDCCHFVCINTQLLVSKRIQSTCGKDESHVPISIWLSSIILLVKKTKQNKTRKQVAS